MSNDSKSWRDRWPRWRDLDHGGKMLRLTVYILVIGFLTFLATVGAGAGWFSGQPAAETSIPQVNPTTTTIATTSTSLDALSYEYDPSSSQTPERIGEGESHVFFDRDERGLTVQIGSIDDDPLTASSVTAFVSGEGKCRWNDIGSGSGPLIYRTEQTEYEITVDIPWQFGAEVRVAKRISGELTGSESCEPTTG